MTWFPWQFKTEGDVTSGDSLNVKSGASLDIKSGAALKLAGVTVTPTAAELNALHSQGAVAADYAKLHAITVTAAAINAGNVAGLTTTGAHIDDMYAEFVARLTSPLVIRTNLTAANIHTSGAAVASVVPAVAGMRFHATAIMMRSNGGNAGTAVTIGVKEDGGAVFLSHIAADMTSGVWHDLVTGTPVITGMTSGGTTAVANKALIAYDAGGALSGTVTMDFIVSGFYTTI